MAGQHIGGERGLGHGCVPQPDQYGNRTTGNGTTSTVDGGGDICGSGRRWI